MRHEVAGYPCDGELLTKSRLYRVSRTLYLKQSGLFRPSLISAARSLSSPALLENTIEYSPLASELAWAGLNRRRKKNADDLSALSRFVSSLYHEQNHRILWRLLPSAPHKAAELRRYLNLAESLVIVADMALGDELGPKQARRYRDLGVIYDPGTDVKRAAKDARVYRNYLQACLQATYLNLEAFKPALIAKVIPALYSDILDDALVGRAIARASNLNRGFITKTNLSWQHKHQKQVIVKLARAEGKALQIADDPLNNIDQYMLAEKWFDLFKI